MIDAPKNCPGPEQCAPVRAAGGWHLKREIQLGHLLTTATMFLSAVLFVLAMDKRLVIVETRLAAAMVTQSERDDRQDKSAVDALALLRSQLSNIDSKLDRLIERRIDGKGGK